MPEPTDPILIRHLAQRNFLSFGPDNAGIELKALNLFIGPNGSGKSESHRSHQPDAVRAEGVSRRYAQGWWRGGMDLEGCAHKA